MKLVDLGRKLTERMKRRRRCLKTNCECLKLPIFLDGRTPNHLPQTAVFKDFVSWRWFDRGNPAPPLKRPATKIAGRFLFPLIGVSAIE